MKKQLIIVSVLGMLGAASAVALTLKKTTYKSAEAYTATTSLPTTIDLNDSTASEIRNYYSSLSEYSTSERSGTNLLKNLKDILKNGQIYYSYDYSNGTVIWQMYEITDRDWEKSPASEIPGYNSSTNTITGYSYGSSATYSGMNPYLHALYVDRDVDNNIRAWAKTGTTTSHGGNAEWCIDREHIWAKSHGMGSEDKTSASAGARGDPMHLWPGDSDVNSSLHSNYFYGFVNSTSSSSAAWSYAQKNYVGTSLNKGSGTVFEPQDCDKGDIARAIFYMAARYNNYDGDTDIDANNPSFRLFDRTSDSNGTSKYDSTDSTPGEMGVLRDLLAWNRLDPPDEWEIHRNNLLYKNYTNNRNPFIDFPEWAEYIWGNSVLAADNRTITSFNSTSTGTATPASDSINGFKGVAADGVSVTPSSLTLTVNQVQTLSATVSPSNASNKEVTWSSSNSSVASVNASGVVSAKAVGNATITATTVDGGFTATCTVTVNAAPVINYTLSSNSPFINGLPYKLHFYATSLGKELYFTGLKDGYYGGVSDSISNAADVYFEKYGNGQNMYCEATGAKWYLAPYQNGNYINFQYSASLPDGQWNYSSDYGCMVMMINNVPCTFGSYSSNQRLAAHSLTQYPNNYRMELTCTDANGPVAFSYVFLHSLSCDENGEAAPSFNPGVNWSLFSLAYSKLSSDNQNALKNADANEYGSTVEQAMTRYDYICKKYNAYSFDNFIGRASANGSNRFSLLPIMKNNYWLLILLISAGVTFVGLVTFLSIRKKYKNIN